MTMAESAYRAKLLEALMTGPKRPGDLDELVVGHFCFQCVSGLILPPYCDALGELVDEGVVTWHRADDQIVWYQLKEDDKHD